MAETNQVWIGGTWRAAHAEGTFYAENPSTGEKLDRAFPVSAWADCDAALQAAAEAAVELELATPAQIADFLEGFAAEIEAGAAALVEAAHAETGLPAAPRLKDIELPRTTDQLRQAARAAREQTWRGTVIDAQRNIRSCFAPIGPVAIFGPNNFPFAFNAVSGGDMAAAIAAGNPVIAKAHPLHPYTSMLLAQAASRALAKSQLPAATVQMLYHVSNDNGLKLVSDSRVGAVSFTGSRNAGLALKRAAEEAGRPIYLEMSSLNPVVFLPEGTKENAANWATQLADSCTAGSGQFCTRPNLVFLFEGDAAEQFLGTLADLFTSRAPAPLLSGIGRERLHESISALIVAGAQRVTGAEMLAGAGYRYASTLLRVSGEQFLAHPEALQREAFGNAVLAIVVRDEMQLMQVLRHLEGNLTATIYSSAAGADDAVYDRIAPLLRRKSGRLLNDKMPTGVAVSPAMNHGGPYPSTGHPGFTAVGIPASIARFTVLQCYDNVREHRLPGVLRGDS